MIRAHIPTDSIKLLQADLLDENLLAVMAVSAEKFTRASRYSVEANKINMTVQTEEATDVEEDCSRASHPGGVPM